MNSTFRGAVEIFNLCRNLHPEDVLFAECVRTFQECTVDGRSWMFRMEATQLTQQFQENTAETCASRKTAERENWQESSERV